MDNRLARTYIAAWVACYLGIAASCRWHMKKKNIFRDIEFKLGDPQRFRIEVFIQIQI